MKKILAIPIPINELQKYAVLSPIIFFVKLKQLTLKTYVSRPIIK